MAKAKIHPVVKAINEAVTAYNKGASQLVRVYETVINSYWNPEGDARNPVYLQYFVNALCEHPRVQKALINIINRHGAFVWKFEGEFSQKNRKAVELKNKKKVDDEQKAVYKAEVFIFCEAKYNSLLNEENEIKDDFNADRKMESFKKSAFDIVAQLAIRAENADVTEAFNPEAIFDKLAALVEAAKAEPEALAEAIETARRDMEKKASEKQARIDRVNAAKETIQAMDSGATAE